jgi:curved DNA-binding protein CbpA
MADETYYSILGISETASAAEIKTAYLRMIREVHPDRVANAPAYFQRHAEEKTREINEAYAVLSNGEKRRLYDAQLASYRSSQTSAYATSDPQWSAPPTPSSTQQGSQSDSGTQNTANATQQSTQQGAPAPQQHQAGRPTSPPPSNTAYKSVAGTGQSKSVIGAFCILAALLIGAIIFAANNSSTPATGNANLESSNPERASLENIPKFWTFTDSDQTVGVEIKGDHLYEHQDRILRSGRRLKEDCETERDGDRWVGKCHEKVWPLEGGETPQCSWDLDEVITSVSPYRITGETQVDLPPQEGEMCPTPGRSMHEFAYVPKGSQTQSESNASGVSQSPVGKSALVSCSGPGGKSGVFLFEDENHDTAVGKVKCGERVTIQREDKGLHWSKVLTEQGLSGWTEQQYLEAESSAPQEMQTAENAPRKQSTQTEVEGLNVEAISDQVSRLTWAPVHPRFNGDTVSYSVYRGETKNFDASDDTRIASGLTATSYVAHEPKPNGDYYYLVLAE